MHKFDPTEVSIVTNAIAFAMYGDDGREVKTIMGVEGIDATDEEASKCQLAAVRALTQLTDHRNAKTRPFEDCWSGPMIKELSDAGIIPRHTQRVIIDLQGDHFAVMHITAPPTAEHSEKIMDIITAAVQPAQIMEIER